MENTNYDAQYIQTKTETIVFRTSRITPVKAGSFVALWKRDSQGKTIPYDGLDSFDSVVISLPNKQAHFKFPKAVLKIQGIITSEKQVGKRGFRLYTPHDPVVSPQAQKTQAWQVNYYIDKPFEIN